MEKKNKNKKIKGKLKKRQTKTKRFDVNKPTIVQFELCKKGHWVLKLNSISYVQVLNLSTPSLSLSCWLRNRVCVCVIPDDFFSVWTLTNVPEFSCLNAKFCSLLLHYVVYVFCSCSSLFLCHNEFMKNRNAWMKNHFIYLSVGWFVTAL